MNHRVSLAAVAAAAAGLFISSGAQAMITDSLTGPTTSDITVVQSALTGSSSTSADPAAANPFTSSSRSDGFGNSRFGAGYSTGSFTGAPVANMAEAYEYLTADATAFNNYKSILSSYVFSFTNGNSQTANVYNYLYALGSLIRSGNHSGGDFVGTTNLSIISQKLWDSGSQTFWIGPVPITVSAQVFAGAFQEAGGHFWVDGIDGRLNQSARLWVNASGGVGFSWAGGGVKVNNLMLMNAGLPLLAKARYIPFALPTSCLSVFSYSANYSLTLQELSGEVRLYANWLFGGGEYQIASWPGLRQSFTMLNFASARFYGSCFAIPAAPQIASNIVG